MNYEDLFPWMNMAQAFQNEEGVEYGRKGNTVQADVTEGPKREGCS